MTPSTDRRAARWLGASILLLTLSTAPGEPASAIPLTTPLNPPPSRTVQGVILTIRGDEYRIRPLSPAGPSEIRLHVDDRTIRLDQDRFQVGDVIIADVTPDGHALMIGTVRPRAEDRPQGR